MAPEPKSKQLEIIEITKDNIIFLNNIKNTGIMVSGDSGQEYTPFMINQNYRDILDTQIMDLSTNLVEMNKHIIRNFSSSKKFKK